MAAARERLDMHARRLDRDYLLRLGGKEELVTRILWESAHESL